MRLESASWHNSGPFADWSLDLTALDPAQKVIALTGINGKGKSYCMESAIAGGFYRTMPTQGTVAGRATAADSWQKSTFVHDGKRYTIKHLVNAAAKSRPSETIVTDENGKPVYEGTGVKLFDGWAAKHLPDHDVLFASLFAAQQSEGFVKMSSGDRIGIILRVIGVARYERMAAAARKRRDAGAEKLDGLVKRIGDIRGGSPTVEECEAQLATARQTVAAFESSVEERRTALAAGKEADAQARVAMAQREAAIRELAELRRQLDEVTTKRGPVALRFATERAVLAESESIRAASAEVTLLEAALKLDEASLAVAKAEAEAALAPWLDVNQRQAALVQRGERAKSRLKDAAAVQSAKTELPGIRDAVDEGKTEVARIVEQLEEAQAAHVAGADERVTALRSGLTKIVSSEQLEEAVSLGREALETDDTAVALAQTLPARKLELKERLTAARDRLVVAERQLADAERLAARSADVDSAEVDLTEARAEYKILTDSYAAAGEAGKAKQAAVAELVAKVNGQRAALARVQPLAAKLPALASAEARVAELEPQLAAFDADVARLEATIAALPALPAEPQRPNLVVLEGQLERAEALLRFERDGVAKLEQSLEASKVVDSKVAELEAERAAVEAELGIDTRLAIDLGRSGLQSAEVDSAGPELTELVNDLLRTCHGSRFTVSVDTQRLSGDGKKTIDECLISVIDAEKGTEKEVREHSGGERVILGEAISLALTMLACRRAGFDRPTLFRDESAAALDPANARAWVAMMRRAVELTGADRLLFVSHSPEVVEMADAQIPVGEPAAVEARAA